MVFIGHLVNITYWLMYTIMDLMVSVGWQLAGAFGRERGRGDF